MMVALIVVGACSAAGLLGWGIAGPLVDRPTWRRRNYRGVDIAGVSGLVVVGVAVPAILIVRSLDRSDLTDAHAAAALVAVIGFGLLGLVDDVRGGPSGGGFGAHIRALITERRITTGFLKLVLGALVGIVTVVVADLGPVDETSGAAVVRVVRGGALVALGANLLNLFDRAPARATKVAALWWVFLLAGTAVARSTADVVSLAWSATAVGAAIGLAPTEIRERHMQGDTGVNAVGAILGLTVAIVGSAPAQWVVLAALATLNLLSERVSFTLVIDHTPPLRWFDRLGSPFRS